MADSKISALTEATSIGLADEFVLNQGGTSKRITAATLQDLVGLKKGRVSADHAISATAGTEVTLSPVPTLTAGTWMFQFNLIVQSATASVSPMYGINYTGTTTKFFGQLTYPDAGPLTAGTGTADDVGSTAGQPITGMNIKALSTTAPNMGHTGGVATTASDTLVVIQGIIIVSNGGDLELWHGSETATSTTVKQDSTYMVTKVA